MLTTPNPTTSNDQQPQPQLNASPDLVCPFATRQQYGYYPKSAVFPGQDLASFINRQVTRPSYVDPKKRPPIRVYRDGYSRILFMGWLDAGLIPSIPALVGEKNRFELAAGGHSLSPGDATARGRTAPDQAGCMNIAYDNLPKEIDMDGFCIHIYLPTEIEIDRYTPLFLIILG